MLKFAFVLVASYVLLVAVVYFTQARMLYLPNVPARALTMTPANAGMDYQDVSIETADGVTLHGWFVEAQSSRVLLFFHGNAGNISHRLDSIRQLDTTVSSPRLVGIDHRLSWLRPEFWQDDRKRHL
jgi:hypothetical protein